jgi:CubicO group peptidase (beta-lactamase class C family)
MKTTCRSVVVLHLLLAGALPVHAQLPAAGGYEAAPDDWLLGSAPAWHYRSRVADSPVPLETRAARADETALVERARKLVENGPAKAIALVSGHALIWAGYKTGKLADKRFVDLGLGKTITSLAAGRAVCSGRLSMDTRAGEVIPELRSTDLGQANLRQLLTMTSGTWEGYPDSTVASPEEAEAIQKGKLNLLQLVKTEKVSSANRSLLGTRRLPGEEFAYRSTDPLVVGIMLRRSTGLPYAKYVEQEVLLPAGIRAPAIIGQDRFGYGLADGSLRMTLEDWVRVAIWLRERMDAQDCLSKYLEDATTTRVPNRTKKFGSAFEGYGYLIWTDNSRLHDSFWAFGHGGQRIAWNHHNQRIIVAFSNVENYMDELYLLYRDWANLP